MNYAVYRRLSDGFWTRISRLWLSREDAERYAAKQPRDWVLEVREVADE